MNDNERKLVKQIFGLMYVRLVGGKDFIKYFLTTHKGQKFSIVIKIKQTNKTNVPKETRISYDETSVQKEDN